MGFGNWWRKLTMAPEENRTFYRQARPGSGVYRGETKDLAFDDYRYQDHKEREDGNLSWEDRKMLLWQKMALHEKSTPSLAELAKELLAHDPAIDVTHLEFRSNGSFLAVRGSLPTGDMKMRITEKLRTLPGLELFRVDLRIEPQKTPLPQDEKHTLSA